MPPTKMLSFTDTESHRAAAAGAGAAARRRPRPRASAPPRSTWVKAFSTGSVASSRASDCFSNCSGVMSRASSSVDKAVASSCQVMRVSPELSLRPRWMGPSDGVRVLQARKRLFHGIFRKNGPQDATPSEDQRGHDVPVAIEAARSARHAQW